MREDTKQQQNTTKSKTPRWPIVSSSLPASPLLLSAMLLGPGASLYLSFGLHSSIPCAENALLRIPEGSTNPWRLSPLVVMSCPRAETCVPWTQPQPGTEEGVVDVHWVSRVCWWGQRLELVTLTLSPLLGHLPPPPVNSCEMGGFQGWEGRLSGIPWLPCCHFTQICFLFNCIVILLPSHFTHKKTEAMGEGNSLSQGCWWLVVGFRVQI